MQPSSSQYYQKRKRLHVLGATWSIHLIHHWLDQQSTHWFPLFVWQTSEFSQGIPYIIEIIHLEQYQVLLVNCHKRSLVSWLLKNHSVFHASLFIFQGDFSCCVFYMFPLPLIGELIKKLQFSTNPHGHKNSSHIHLASILLTYIRCIFTNVSNLIDIKFSVILVVLFWISWLALATKRSPADSASWRKLGGNRERTDAPVHIGIHNSCFILYIIITCICISIFAVYRVAIPVVTKIMSYPIPPVMKKSKHHQ